MTASDAPGAVPTAPAVILVEPQLGENVGAAARAMANFGLADLRLVAPRFPWPSERAEALAAGAFEGPTAVRATVCDDLAQALGDLRFVLAATARPREIKKPVRLPHEAVAGARAALAAGRGAGIMFGGEKSGLDNDAVALADEIVTYPVAPGFSSLNLAQAVVVFAYEWSAGAAEAPPAGFTEATETPATREELAGLIAQLEDELDAAGFFWPPVKAEPMKRNLKSTLARLGLTGQQVSTLRGAVKAIAEGPRRRARELRARQADAERARKG